MDTLKDKFSMMTAKYFFTHYVTIRSWRKKMSGKNTNGNPLGFSETEQAAIDAAWPVYLNDLKERVNTP